MISLAVVVRYKKFHDYAKVCYSNQIHVVSQTKLTAFGTSAPKTKSSRVAPKT